MVPQIFVVFVVNGWLKYYIRHARLCDEEKLSERIEEAYGKVSHDNLMVYAIHSISRFDDCLKKQHV